MWYWNSASFFWRLIDFAVCVCVFYRLLFPFPSPGRKCETLTNFLFFVIPPPPPSSFLREKGKSLGKSFYFMKSFNFCPSTFVFNWNDNPSTPCKFFKYCLANSNLSDSLIRFYVSVSLYLYIYIPREHAPTFLSNVRAMSTGQRIRIQGQA